jgi:hypothetical protein
MGQRDEAGNRSRRDSSAIAAVGSRYFENMASGLDPADAWDAAAKSVGEEPGMSSTDVLEITNPIGRLRAQAIKDCGS